MLTVLQPFFAGQYHHLWSEMHFWVIVLSFSGVSGLLHLHHAHGGACISKGSVPAELRRKFPINLSTTNIDIDGENDEHIHHGMDDKNPCWQDLYDYDCAMSTIYSASFVAKDWLRSMPCANGVEVSDHFIDQIRQETVGYCIFCISSTEKRCIRLTQHALSIFVASTRTVICRKL